MEGIENLRNLSSNVTADAAADAELCEQLLQQKIDWRPYKDINAISEEDAALLACYQSKDAAGKLEMLEEQGSQCAEVLVRVVPKIQAKNTRLALLVTAADLLESDFHGKKHFSGVAAERSTFQPLLMMMKTEKDPFALGKVHQILASLLSYAEEESSFHSAEALEFVQELALLTQDSKTFVGQRRMYTVRALKVLLQNRFACSLFLQHTDQAVGGLVKQSMEVQNTELVYVICFCFWLLSFNENRVEVLTKWGVVKRLASILKTVAREKVVRVALACLVNVVGGGGEKSGDIGADSSSSSGSAAGLPQEEQKAHDSFVRKGSQVVHSYKTAAGRLQFKKELIGLGLLPILAGLSRRKWKDVDLVKDLKLLLTQLEAVLTELSSFEMLEAECQSKNLHWSPVHNERFWREHYSKIEQNNFEIVGQLVELLDSDSEICEEVACYDLGEIARFHPDGKRVIGQKGKNRILLKMQHKNPKVAKQALLAVQKLMVDKWENLDITSVFSKTS